MDLTSRVFFNTLLAHIIALEHTAQVIDLLVPVNITTTSPRSVPRNRRRVRLPVPLQGLPPRSTVTPGSRVAPRCDRRCFVGLQGCGCRATSFATTMPVRQPTQGPVSLSAYPLPGADQIHIAKPIAGGEFFRSGYRSRYEMVFLVELVFRFRREIFNVP
jgi:hypothetical protein